MNTELLDEGYSKEDIVALDDAIHVLRKLSAVDEYIMTHDYTKNSEGFRAHKGAMEEREEVIKYLEGVRVQIQELMA